MKEVGTIEDADDGVPIKVRRDDAGVFKITNLKTGDKIAKERDLRFARYAFYPETERYVKS